jgi:hypothetical protein
MGNLSYAQLYKAVIFQHEIEFNVCWRCQVKVMVKKSMVQKLDFNFLSLLLLKLIF